MCAPCPHIGLALFFPFLTSLPLGSLETSALHVALISEWAAFGWRGAFVHLDLTLISRGELVQLVPFANRDSTGTLFVATALVGIAQYRKTRRVVTLLLVIFLDVVMAVAVVVQLFHWALSAKRVDAQVAANAASGGGGGYSYGDEEQGGGGGRTHAAVRKAAWKVPPAESSTASLEGDSADWPLAADSPSTG